MTLRILILFGSVMLAQAAPLRHAVVTNSIPASIMPKTVVTTATPAKPTHYVRNLPMAKAAVVVYVEPEPVMIEWQHALGSNLVFNVYSSSDLAAPLKQWSTKGTTPALFMDVLPTNGCEFFTVTCSNTVTGLESGYASK